jgi:putative ABC transport system permease protein
MGAVRLKTLADLRHRRLQSLGIALILLLSTAAGTLASSILVESHAPFDHAFQAANGAHVVIRYRGDIDPGRLAATGEASAVTASAGPWPVAEGAIGYPNGDRLVGGEFAGRPQPDRAIDNVTVHAGRWWQAAGEIVLDQSTARLLDRGVGETVTVYPPPSTAKSAADPFGTSGAPGRDLVVVGIAGSVSTPDVSAWIAPTDVVAIALDGPPEQEMLYRVAPSSTAVDLGTATAAITGGLAPDAVRDSQTYLEVKAGVDQLADLYVPVLLAFAIFALLAAAFLITNIVTGVVLTSYRDIGLMKAVGYTPGQVSLILAGQVLTPAIIGAVAGVAVGTVASEPVIRDAAESFGLPSAYVMSAPVVVTVLGVALAISLLAALVPCVRAGRISPVDAMTRGSAPSLRPDGGRLRRLGLALPLGLPGRLGVSAGLAHPVRTSMMLGALVVGVAAATFALGLNWSLLRVMTDLNRDAASPIRVETVGAEASTRKMVDPSGSTAGAADPAQITAAIAGDPGTGRFVAIGQVDVNIPGMAPLPFVGYDGDTSWLGYAVIEGSWFSVSGQAVAPTDFFTQSGLHIGDTTTIVANGRSVDVELVGEIFDIPGESGDSLVLRGTWADVMSLDPSVQPSRWEAQPIADVDRHSYRDAIQEAIGFGAQAHVEGESTDDGSFVLFLSVVAMLGIVLVAMSLGGVFDTVLLETRQRTREVAVLKVVGLTPAQVVAMVIATVVPVGLVAGLLGVPIGLAAQRLVLAQMGEVAARTRIPEQVYDVFPLVVLVGLGLLGLVIGAAGAYVPAQRAARARIAPVLQAE